MVYAGLTAVCSCFLAHHAMTSASVSRAHVRDPKHSSHFHYRSAYCTRNLYAMHDDIYSFCARRRAPSYASISIPNAPRLQNLKKKTMFLLFVLSYGTRILSPSLTVTCFFFTAWSTHDDNNGTAASRPQLSAKVGEVDATTTFAPKAAAGARCGPPTTRVVHVEGKHLSMVAFTDYFRGPAICPCTPVGEPFLYSFCATAGGGGGREVPGYYTGRFSDDPSFSDIL